jgi:hypothetical protein
VRLPRRSGRGRRAAPVVGKVPGLRYRPVALGPGARRGTGRARPRAGAPRPGGHHPGSQRGDVRPGPGTGGDGRDPPDRRPSRHAGLQHPRPVRSRHHHAQLALPPADPRRPAPAPGLRGASPSPGLPLHHRDGASGGLLRRRTQDQQRVDQRGERRNGQRALGRREGRDRPDHADHQGTRQRHLPQAGRRRADRHRRRAQPVLDRDRTGRRDPASRRVRRRSQLRGLRRRHLGGGVGRLADDPRTAP